MGNVHVQVTNKSDGVVTLLLDEKDERIDYLKKLVKRDELEAVKIVDPAPKPRASKSS